MALKISAGRQLVGSEAMPAIYSVLAYNKTEMRFSESVHLDEILPDIGSNCVNWVTLSGVNLADDHAAVKKVIDHFNLKPELLEHLFKHGQEPLEDDLDDCMLLEYTILLYRPSKRAHTRVRGSIVLGTNFLILFEKTPSGLFERTRRRIISKHTRAQDHGADYLLYLLFRTIVINYQKIIKSLSEKFERLEDEVIEHPARETGYDKILALREEIKPLYTHFTDLIELIGDVHEDASLLIRKEARRSFARSLNHDARELLESYQHLRAWIAELIEIHRANVNESTNRVMKALTIISTIFLPLTFIAGVYGMNFDNMPELRWEYGYPAVMIFMLILAVGALLYMRHKKWI